MDKIYIGEVARTTNFEQQYRSFNADELDLGVEFDYQEKVLYFFYGKWIHVTINTYADYLFYKDKLFDANTNLPKSNYRVRLLQLSKESIETLGFRTISEILTPRIRGKEKDQFYYEFEFKGIDAYNKFKGDPVRLKFFTVFSTTLPYPNHPASAGRPEYTVTTKVVIPGVYSGYVGSVAELATILDQNGFVYTAPSTGSIIVKREELSYAIAPSEYDFRSFTLKPNTRYIFTADKILGATIWRFIMQFYDAQGNNITETYDLDNITLKDCYPQKDHFVLVGQQAGSMILSYANTESLTFELVNTNAAEMYLALTEGTVTRKTKTAGFKQYEMLS